MTTTNRIQNLSLSTTKQVSATFLNALIPRFYRGPSLCYWCYMSHFWCINLSRILEHLSVLWLHQNLVNQVVQYCINLFSVFFFFFLAGMTLAKRLFFLVNSVIKSNAQHGSLSEIEQIYKLLLGIILRHGVRSLFSSPPWARYSLRINARGNGVYYHFGGLWNRSFVTDQGKILHLCQLWESRIQ